MKTFALIAVLSASYLTYTYEDFCLGDTGTQEYMTGNQTWIGTYCTFADHESIIWGKGKN